MVRVNQSTIIDAPIAQVWAILRDFNGHDRWHPAIASSHIEGGAPSDMIGAVRRFRLADGAELREQLLSLSDHQHRFSYCLLSSPIPLMGYVAQVRLLPVTDDQRTFWEWSSTFTTPAGRDAELAALVGDGIYRAGFAAIRAALRDDTPLRRVPVSTSQIPARSMAPNASPTGRTHAIVIDRHGGPEEMRLREIDLPPPPPGQVQIRHHAIGVNFIDVYCRTGYFPLITPPGTPGMEAAGVITALGAGVEGLRVGDRVAYACPPVGAYSESRNMVPDLLIRLPDDISFELAAASLLKGVSASFLLTEIARIKPGSTVLIHAAAGGIGQILVQWGRHLGAEVIGTTSTPDKVKLVRDLGAHHVINYASEDFVESVSDLTGGRGVDVVFEAVGKTTFAKSLECLAECGQVISYGQASGPVGNIDVDRLATRSITVSRPNYAHYTNTPEKLGHHVNQFFAALRSGIIAVPKPTTYPLGNAAQAHRDLESRRTMGALVLLPDAAGDG